MMRDPQAILSQAREGAVPPGWAVFTKKRGRVRGLLSGTSDDPDPLLVVTPEGVVEFASHRSGLETVDFDHLSQVVLRVRGHSFSDSTIVNLDVWLDLRLRDGQTQKWKSSAFADDYRTVQSVLEAYGAFKMLHGGR